MHPAPETHEELPALHEGLAEQDQPLMNVLEVECLPAKGEDASRLTENNEISVHAVKIRQQTAKEKAELEEDDRVSICLRTKAS